MTWVILSVAMWGVVSLLATLLVARRLGRHPSCGVQFGPSLLGASGSLGAAGRP